MSGRAATTDIIPGKYAIAIGIPDKPLPKGWKWVRLSDVATMATGHTPSRLHAEYWDGEIAWIGIKDAREYHCRRINSTFQTVTQAGIDNSASVILPRNTVCLSRTASVGYVTIMDRPMATSQDFVNWTCSKALVPEFLMYLLVAERESLLRFGKGTTHTTIYFPEAKALSIGLPPVAEQQCIVSKIEEAFSDLDVGAAALERARASLKRYRAAVLKAAVEGRLTEKWRQSHPVAEPASELLERILIERRKKWEQAQLAKFAAAEKNPPKQWRDKYEHAAKPKSDLPKLPKGWCWATIEQLNAGDRPIAYGVLQPGPDLPDGTPIIRVCDVDDGRVDATGIKRIAVTISEKFQRTIVEGGEVLLTIVGTIGRTAVVPQSLKGANTARAVAVLPITRQIDPRYVEINLRAPAMRARLTKSAHEVARKTLNLEDVRPACIPLAPLGEQEQLIAEVERRLSIARQTEAQTEYELQRVSRLRQSILKHAFDGKLVPQDSDNHEPQLFEPSGNSAINLAR